MSESVVSTVSSSSSGRRSPDEFDGLLARVRERVSTMPGPYFRMEPEIPLFDVYLDAFGPVPENGAPSTPESRRRQVHNCVCCWRFLRRYGALATIKEGSGHIRPLFWSSEAEGEYSDVERALARAVASAPIGGVFYDPDATWGQPTTGDWTHFGLPSPKRFISVTESAESAMAEKRRDYELIQRTLAVYDYSLVRRAVAILETGQLQREEKVLGAAKWLAGVYESIAGEKPKRMREALIWRAVAVAPDGFAHAKNNMLGTLLDDLKAGKSFSQLSQGFAKKMEADTYQRPKAAPSEGNIDQAEKLFAKMGASGALKRRFARLEDLKTIWTPKPPPAPVEGGGVFDHLRPGRAATAPMVLDVPPAPMTWVRFAEEVLPRAEEIEYLVPRGWLLISAFITAADPEAPPIIQWDRPEKDKRNPVSWYCRHPRHDSSAETWNLVPNSWRKVNAIALCPAHWDPEVPMPHHEQAATLVLDQCWDRTYSPGRGGGLFPEIMKSEFREVRATLEAYMRDALIADHEKATACGLRLSDGNMDAVVRVLDRGIKTAYRLGRWS